MPTRGGWLLGLWSVAAGVSGRLLGLRELYLVAAGSGALLAGALAYVRSRPIALGTTRDLDPARVTAGGACRVDLTLTNHGRRRAPPLDVDDATGGRFRLAGLSPAETARATYRFGPTGRGLVAVGPLRVGLHDPFGLAISETTVLDPSTLIVHPRVDPITLPAERRGSPAASGARSAVPPRRGDDFHSLRPYEEGDDLRLVHWPTSARLDALVVRQDEAPLVRRTVLALDLRHAVHDAVTLERAVSAAAGVAAAACDGEGLLRLVTTAGADSGSAGGPGHLTSVLDLLATVQSHEGGGAGPLTSALAGDEGATAVLVTTRSVPPGDLEALARLGPHCALLVAVLVDRWSGGGRAPQPSVPAAFDLVVAVAGEVPFGVAWERAVSRSGAPA